MTHQFLENWLMTHVDKANILLFEENCKLAQEPKQQKVAKMTLYKTVLYILNYITEYQCFIKNGSQVKKLIINKYLTI